MKSTKALLLMAAVAAVLSFGCPKKEDPGPSPEPTPVPTVGRVDEAICKTEVPGSYTRCQDIDGNLVTCPADTSQLPECP